MGVKYPLYFTLFLAHFRPLNFQPCNHTTKNISPCYGLKNSLHCLSTLWACLTMPTPERARTGTADPPHSVKHGGLTHSVKHGGKIGLVENRTRLNPWWKTKWKVP
jgi:hypothetical protein